MKTKYYCPICGFELDEFFATGVICSCCGNECGFSESLIIRDGIDPDEYDDYYTKGGEFLMKGLEIPKEITDFINNAEFTPEEAWEKLREIWIKNGCKFDFNLYNKKPENWGIELVKKQLLNINIDLDKLLNSYK